MKGGKSGRKKKPGQKGSARGKPRVVQAKHPASVPPKKGSRKTPYGGTSASGEDY
jgi:hypothetical protein